MLLVGFLMTSASTIKAETIQDAGHTEAGQFVNGQDPYCSPITYSEPLVYPTYAMGCV